jgi:hypothetical protein
MNFKQYILKENKETDYSVSDKIHTTNKISTDFSFKFLFKGKKYYAFIRYLVNVDYKIVNNKYESVVYGDPAPNIEIIHVNIFSSGDANIKEIDDKGREISHIVSGHEHYSYFRTHFIPGMFIKFIKNKKFFVRNLDEGISHHVGEIGVHIIDLSKDIYTHNHQ